LGRGWHDRRLILPEPELLALADFKDFALKPVPLGNLGFERGEHLAQRDRAIQRALLQTDPQAHS